MSHSFSATGTGALAELDESKRRVLVTGAAGRIGSYFAEHTHHKYDLRLMVQEMDEDAEKIREFGEVVQGDLRELQKLKGLFEGVDTVLHLAGDPSPSATWESLHETNIVGTYNVYVAAKAAGCRRVIYASSIHAVSGYPRDVQVKTSEPVNPGDLYGVSKCFGESMGRYMAEQENLSVIALRIGAFQPPEAARKEQIHMMDAWVSHRDLTQLIEKCVDVQNVKWAVLHGLSNNTFKRLDISDARELVGYEPQDDFSDYNPLLKPLDLPHQVESHAAGSNPEKSGLRDELQELSDEK